MPSAASEEEQGGQGPAEIVPATSDQPEEMEERYQEKFELLLDQTSALLEAGGPRRISGYLERRALEFLKIVLTDIVESLRDNHAHDSGWLRELSALERYIKEDYLETDPGGHTVLPRARQHFHTGKPDSPWFRLVYRLTDITEDPSRYRHLLRSSSDLGLPHQVAEVGVPPLFGIDRPAKKLLRWLGPRSETGKRLRVMAIVGAAGIGKTTLAMELRNRLIRSDHSGGQQCYFQHNAMAQVSRGTDKHRLLLQDILSQISDPAEPALSLDQSQPDAMALLVRLVSERLQRKRYFIIIDDVWDASDWEKIRDAFPSTNIDSRILITTRFTSTATACFSQSDVVLVHEMKPLNEMDSERLLLAKAFGSVYDGCPPHSKVKWLCDDILRRCEGVPLFITCMADSLREQFKQQQQRGDEHQIFKNQQRQIRQLPQRLEQALSSAFNDLPDKLLFPSLYMSMFPDGYKFDKDLLDWKWRSEGLCGMGSFSQLVDANVISCDAQNSKHNLDLDEAATSQWHVNPLLQQFLASKAAEIGFALTSATLELAAAAAASTTGCGNKGSRTPWRLSLHHPHRNIQLALEEMDLSLTLEKMDLSWTRSLTVSGAVREVPLDRFVNLVVLDLQGWKKLEDEDLLQICRSKMFFLRYLSIRNTRVSKIPDEIKELYMLEMLDASYTQISELPLLVFELKELVCLDLRGTRISHLPKQIGGLKCINHLLIGGQGTNNPVETVKQGVSHTAGMACLTSLSEDTKPTCAFSSSANCFVACAGMFSPCHHQQAQSANQGWEKPLLTLTTVDLTQNPASLIRALGDLRYLETLAITWSFHQSIDRDYCEALVSSIGKWTRLRSLTIHCGLGCSLEFLGSLYYLPTGLEKLKVTAGRFASLPQWINRLRYLTFLQITVCKPGTDGLKILGGLPKLQCLILGLDFIPSEAIVIENMGFRYLQRFSIDCPMPWVTFSQEAMRTLTRLQLKFCATPASQTSVPSGIGNLCSITEVTLCYNEHYVNSTSIKMTVEAVRKQVSVHRNPVDLFINGIEQDDVQAVDEEIENAIGAPSGTAARAGDDDAQAVAEEIIEAVQSEITEG